MALLALCAFPFSPAFAQWSGKAEGGVALASGNSDTKSGNAKLTVSRKLDAWQYTVGLAGNYVSSGDDTTARRFEAFGQSRYQFNEHNYWYGGTRYENDRFSGFLYQAVLSTGVGRRFIDNDATQFNGELGVGSKYVESRDSQAGSVLVPGHSQASVALVGGTDFTHKLTETTTVYDKSGFEAASGSKFLQNEIGMTVKMTFHMALALAFTVRHNTAPPSGFRKTDTLTTVNLVYEVK